MNRALCFLAVMATLTPVPVLATTNLTAASVGPGPYYLDKAGETYLLTQDVSVPGTAFVFAAQNVTLDLGGHSVTFGNEDRAFRYGVAIPPPYPHTNPVWSGSDITRWINCSGATVRNGAVVQGTAHADSCGAVFVYGEDRVNINTLTIRVYGADSFPILVAEGSGYMIYGNTIEDGTRVIANRHQGRAAIDVVAVLDGQLEVFNNVVNDCPQWGIRVTRRTPYVTWGRIYNNTIRPSTVVTNGYAIGAHSGRLEVYDNEIHAVNGRGIHLEAVDSLRVHQNNVEVIEQPTWDEYTRVSAHGIKLERCNHADVYGNTVISYGLVNDPLAESNGAALSISLAAGTSNWIHDNDITSRHLRGTAFNVDNYVSFAAAVEMVSIEAGSSIIIENNRFRTNDRFVFVSEWAAADGGLIDGAGIVYRNNAFEWDTRVSRTGRNELLFGSAHFTGLVFADSNFGPDVDFRRFTAGWPWQYCSWGVGSQVQVHTVDGSGLPVAGVPIECRDAAGSLLRSAVSGPDGLAAVSLAAFSISTEGAGSEQVVHLLDHNPYRVIGTFSAGTAEAPVIAGNAGTSVSVVNPGDTGSTPLPDGPPLDWAFTVVSTTPAPGGSVPGTGEIRWFFNEPVLLSSLSEDKLVVTGTASGVIGGSLNLGMNGRLVTFRPSGEFAPGESVSARLSGMVRSASGRYLDGNGDRHPQAEDGDAFELHLEVESAP